MFSKMHRSLGVLTPHYNKLYGLKQNKIERVLRYASTTSQLKPMKHMPGLSSLPIIGTLHHFLPVIGTVGKINNFFEMTEVLHKKYGSIVKMQVRNKKMVLLFDPRDFDKVYRAEETNPLRPGFETLVYYRTVLRKSTYDGVYGLTTAQGMDWRSFRTKVNPALLKPQLVKLYTAPLTDVAEEMVQRLKGIKDDTGYLSSHLYFEVTKWSLESVAYVALGKRIGCLDMHLEDDHPSRQLLKCVKDIMDLAYQLEMLPSLWKYFSTKNYIRLVDAYDTQWDLSARYIEQAKRSIKEKPTVNDEDKSIIEKLIEIDEKVAIMMANEMLLAGIDTVAFATTALLYHLASNPDKQAALRHEIRSGGGSRRYLKACLKETLRIWPVIPANLRKTTKEHEIGGYLIPPGVDVVAPNEYLSKLEIHYPRPLEFIPERWLADKSDPLYYGNAHPMVTLPFGFGVRSCIGRRIAELQIELLISKIIDEFIITWYGPPIKIKTTLFNVFEAPYNFKFDSAKKD